MNKKYFDKEKGMENLIDSKALGEESAAEMAAVKIEKERAR